MLPPSQVQAEVGLMSEYFRSSVFSEFAFHRRGYQEWLSSLPFSKL